MTDAQHNPRRCKALFARLSEYLDNELDIKTRRLIEAHLEKCQPCQVCLQTLKRTVALCRNIDSVPVPAGFSRRLKHLLDEKADQDETGGR